MDQKWKVNRLTVTLGASVLFFGIGALVWAFYFMPFVRTNDAQIDGFKVSVSADISARIIKIHVDEGDFVKQGDLICDLDDSILQSQKEWAKANVLSTAAAVALEEFHYEKLRNDFERADKGFSDGVISEQEFDHAQKNLAIARSGQFKTGSKGNSGY